MLQAWKDINWLDQSAHVGLGILIVVGLSFVLPLWAGVVLSLACAVTREMWQHPWTCHDGCRTDLLFWTSGSGLAALALYLVA